MLQTASQDYINYLNSRATAPGYLVEIQFSDTLRHSTHGRVQAMGEEWFGGVKVKQLAEVVGAGMEAEIELANDGYQVLPYLDNNGAHHSPVRIWFWDRDGGEAPALVFSGRVFDVPDRGDVVVLSASTVGRIGAVAPDVPAGPPFLNYATPPGTIVYFGGQRIVLE